MNMQEESNEQSRINKQHQVYALIDPRDKTTHYVGVSKNAYSRLAQHMSEVENEKRAWLSELKRLGLSPELQILETIENDQDIVSIALEREKHWIDRFSRSGSPLSNIINVPRMSSKEKHIAYSTDRELNPFQQAVNDAGLTVAQLSKESDVSHNTIAKVARGMPVNAYLAARLCKTLNHYLNEQVTYQCLNIAIVGNRRTKVYKAQDSDFER